MVLTENGQAVSTLPLPIGGGLWAEPMEKLIEQEIELKLALKERGYHFTDAVYTFLFLQSTHLPFVRITQIGVVWGDEKQSTHSYDRKIGEEDES